MRDLGSDKNWEIEKMKDALDKKLGCLAASQKYNKAVFGILRVSSDYSKIAFNPSDFFTKDELREEEIKDFVSGCKTISEKIALYRGKAMEIVAGNQEEELSKNTIKIIENEEEKEETREYKNTLSSYEKELFGIGLIEIGGIWYFDECVGWKKWPKIGEKYLSNFPSSKWNKKRGIGTPTGVIQNKDYLKEMFRNLGFNVATEEQELERYKNILLSHKAELKKIGLIEINSVWYFSECIQSKEWPRIGKNYLGNFPSATLNKEWGIGKSSGTIQNNKELRIMFKNLGFNVATEEQELERYKNILLSHKAELKKIGLKEIRGVWYFYKCRGNQDWPKIGKIGKRYLASFLPTDIIREKGIGRDKGDITSKMQLKKMFRVLGISIATSEQEGKEKRREKDRQAKKVTDIQSKTTQKKGIEELIQVMQASTEFNREVIIQNFGDEFQKLVRGKVILKHGEYTPEGEREYLLNFDKISDKVFLEFIREKLHESDRADLKKLFPELTDADLLGFIACLIQERTRVLNGSK